LDAPNHIKEIRMRSTSKFAWLAPLALMALLPIAAGAGPVDINKADAVTIAKELDRVGLAKAKAIVEYREKNGAFKSVEDLRKVKGIGAKTLEQNRANIRLGEGAKKTG